MPDSLVRWPYPQLTAYINSKPGFLPRLFLSVFSANPGGNRLAAGFRALIVPHYLWARKKLPIPVSLSLATSNSSGRLKDAKTPPILTAASRYFHSFSFRVTARRTTGRPYFSRNASRALLSFSPFSSSEPAKSDSWRKPFTRPAAWIPAKRQGGATLL
ncbi:MAG: hypothetical protein PWP70_136 [Moorella sp. (in: firmicutes)]|nr:hypothetical protein [Moorella sp. (in: firmicutes)]